MDEALAAGFARLRYFEEDGARMARNAIRACFTFTLLERRTMPLDSLPDHLARWRCSATPTGASSD